MSKPVNRINPNLRLAESSRNYYQIGPSEWGHNILKLITGKKGRRWRKGTETYDFTATYRQGKES